MNKIRIYCATILVVCLQTVIGTEFTFELKENTETCFHEMIVAGTPVSLEFQVKLYFENVKQLVNKF